MAPPILRALFRRVFAHRDTMMALRLSWRPWPFDPVGRGVAGGEHEDRGVIAGLTEQAAHLEAVRSGHEDVQHHRVRGEGGAGVEGLVSVARGRHAIGFGPEGPLYGLPDGRVIVHDQHLRGVHDPSVSPRYLRAR
jgi:hypothetical protein